MLSRHNLHEYQRKAIDFIKNEKRCALFLDLGLGKTATTLTAITDLIDSFSVSKVLVVSPLRVAKSVWPKEPSQWSHLKDLRVSVVTGSERQRRAALQQDADIYSINRENLVWLVELFGKKWPFDCVVIDESSSFKNPSSKRFRALKRILPYTEYMVLLTGTPSPNSLLDLWAQCYLVDFGMALGRTFTGYKQRFFEQDYMGYNYTLRQGSDGTIHNLIRPFTLSMSAEDYLELPKRIDLIEYVDLPKRTMDDYLQFEKELLLELDDGEEIEAVNAAALAGKLLQWCISENTLVVTSIGLVPIQKITDTHEIWDGENWVNCYGSICNGYKAVVNCYGIYMTPEHQVFTKNGWLSAKEVLNGESCERFEREYLRNPHRITSSWIKRRQGDLALSLRLWERSGKAEPKPKGHSQEQIQKVLRLFTRFMGKNSRYEQHSPNDYLAKHDKSLLQSEGQRFQKLRCSRNNCLRRMAKFFREVLGRFTRRLLRPINIGPSEQFSNVLEAKLQMGHTERAGAEHQKVNRYLDTRRGYESNRSSGILRHKCEDASCQDIQIQNAEREMVYKTKVYDLINCGPNNRFTVVDDNGEPLIVHNCNGAVYTDEARNWSEVHKLKLDVLEELVEHNDEPMLVAYNFKSDLSRIQDRFPDAVVLDKDPETIERWNRGEINMLLAHPASAGHGLNLQKGGSLIVWFGLNWSLELYQQFNARLHRQGQDKPVRIIHLVAQGCLDERVMRVLSDKAATQGKLLEALKVIV